LNQVTKLRLDLGEAWLWAKLMFTAYGDTFGIVQKSAAYQTTFADLTYFAIFIGYPRSGHSLIGSLLDAHPNTLIAHRVNVLKYAQAGYKPTELFYLMLRNSARFAQTGRQLTRYAYPVPGQWQGKFQTLQVIGDQDGKGALQRLASDATLLPGLTQMAKPQVKFIHVIRNPYDNITTWSLRLNRSLAHTSTRYFALCETVNQIKASIDASCFIDIGYEQFVADPRNGLCELCRFLGLTPSDEYLQACLRIVGKSPHQSRHDRVWSPKLVAWVQEQITHYAFLKDYVAQPDLRGLTNSRKS